MFGMGFTEILFIAVIAILFLGPDKLPDAMIQVAKLFKSISKTVNEAKSSFEEEIHIKELREEALNYRKQFENTTNDITGFKNSIPNPAAELQNAIGSIGGDRYLDDDIMDDILAAEAKESEPTVDDTSHTPDDHTSQDDDNHADEHLDDTSHQTNNAQTNHTDTDREIS